MGQCPAQLLGRKGAVGIPKHGFIEREALKQKYFLNIYVHIYTVHCKQTFGVRTNTGQGAVSRETRILFLVHSRLRWGLVLYLLMCLDSVEMSNWYIHLLMVCPSRLAGCCKQGIENYFCPAFHFILVT